MLKKFLGAPAKSYKTAEDAYAAIEKIYSANVSHLQASFKAFAKGELKPGERVSGYYPYIRFKADNVSRPDSRLYDGPPS
jgi:hypothetical protein